MNPRFWKQHTGFRLGVGIALLLLLLCAIALSLCVGSYPVEPRLLFRILCGLDPDSGAANVIQAIRLPRILLGAMVGAGFAVSGTILQGVMRNPLASPDIIGVSSGGGLAGIVIMLCFPQWNFLLLPAAFCGALITACAVYILAWKRGASPVRLILSGVAVSAMLGAFSSTLLLFHAEKAGGVLDFTIGSLATRGWPQISLAGPYLAAGFLAACLLSGKLNLLALGDDTASALGLNVESVRFQLLSVAALLAAASVSAAGLLGFVGLIAPHMVRLMSGADNRFLIPQSALAGAFLVVSCDTLGRLVMVPSELPAGIPMALLGPPFFLWLLRRFSHEHSNA